MTISQFEGIMDRFTDFTAENVKQVLNTININVLYSKIKEMSVSLFVFKKNINISNREKNHKIK